MPLHMSPAIEEFFNRNHSKADGRFSSGGSGGSAPRVNKSGHTNQDHSMALRSKYKITGSKGKDAINITRLDRGSPERKAASQMFEKHYGAGGKGASSKVTVKNDWHNANHALNDGAGKGTKVSAAQKVAAFKQDKASSARGGNRSAAAKDRAHNAQVGLKAEAKAQGKEITSRQPAGQKAYDKAKTAAAKVSPAAAAAYKKAIAKMNANPTKANISAYHKAYKATGL